MDALSDYLISSRCEINSGRKLIVSGCKRVVKYNNDYVKIALCDMAIEIEGADLSIKSYFDTDIELCGVIYEIRFTDRRKNDGNT
ncbi:MAG: YabP/YqfC family sporulation protein [Clostridia bacterium]|nr:YabP/YqfC family sporulation protein [Clostridia bacterium]